MKTEHYEDSIEYKDMADMIIWEEEKLRWIKTMGVRISYVSCTKEKTNNGKLVLGECIKVEELQQVYCPYDFIIVIYEPNIIGMDLNQIRILLHHELLHIGYEDTKTGVKYKVVPHDIEEFREIIDKYGLDWVR